jgi:hypothetical protein
MTTSSHAIPFLFQNTEICLQSDLTVLHIPHRFITILSAWKPFAQEDSFTYLVDIDNYVMVSLILSTKYGHKLTEDFVVQDL